MILRPRHFQPADLIRDHPLVHNMSFCSFPGYSGGGDIIAPFAPAIAGSATGEASPYGLVMSASGANDYIPYFAIPDNGVMSAVVLANPTSSSTLAAAMYWLNPPSYPDNMQLFSFNTDIGLGASPGRFACFCYAFGGSAFAVDSSAGTVDGNWHLFGFSRDINVGTAALNLYADGVPATGSAGDNLGVIFDPAATQFQIGAGNGVYQCAFAAFWNNRCLTAAEHLSFAQNPWQIFQPRLLRSPKLGSVTAYVPIVTIDPLMFAAGL